jgi:hypothetical protein
MVIGMENLCVGIGEQKRDLNRIEETSGFLNGLRLRSIHFHSFSLLTGTESSVNSDYRSYPIVRNTLKMSRLLSMDIITLLTQTLKYGIFVLDERLGGG